MNVSNKGKEKTNLPTTVAGAQQLPAHLATTMAGDAGKGVSKDAADNIVPLIKVLQPLSKAVQRTNPEYIEGAAPGAILLKGYPRPLVEGNVGIVVQPCFFHKAWVEWQSEQANSGYINQHIDRPAEFQEMPDPKDANKKIWKNPANGHIVVETRYHSVLLYLPDVVRPIPYVIPFSGSGHTVSRNWMFMMNQKLVGNERAPSFSSLYKLTTHPKKNAKGEWFIFVVEDLGWVPDEERYTAGKNLYESFASGMLKADVDQEPEGAAEVTATANAQSGAGDNNAAM